MAMPVHCVEDADDVQDDRTPLERIRVEDLITVERRPPRDAGGDGLRDRGRRVDNAPAWGEGRDQRDRDEERAPVQSRWTLRAVVDAPGATETAQAPVRDRRGDAAGSPIRGAVA